MRDYFGHFYEFVQRDEVQHDHARVRVGDRAPVLRLGGDHGRDHAGGQRARRRFVIIQRINLGLYAIFGQLHATANWRRISEEIWPFVDGPPSHGARATGGRVGGAARSTVIEVVALDGDDTLWHSEHLFVDTQDRFRALVRPYVDLDDDGPRRRGSSRSSAATSRSSATA